MHNNPFFTFKNYMKKSPLTACEEDYLEMIYRLGKDDIRLSELANSLNISNASASKMVKKLKSKNYLNQDRYQKMSLTDSGKEMAKVLYERHHLLESFFKLLDDTENLTEKVEKIEHTLEAETLSKIQLLLVFFKNNKEYHDALKSFINQFVTASSVD